MFRMTFDDKDLQKGLTELERSQLPVATMWALNDSANDVLEDLRSRMQVAFDRPTRWTLNAFQVWRARKSKLEAAVQERPSVSSRHYLKVQERGGPRPQKGIEGLLATHLDYDGIITAAIPTGAARLDAFGNWSAGERNQVLSDLGAQRDATANMTSTSRGRASNRTRAAYFVRRTGQTGGVFRRSANGSVAKVLNLTPKVPVYRPRLKFYDGSAEVFARVIGDHFRRALKKAITTR